MSYRSNGNNPKKPEQIQQSIPVPSHKIGWIVGRRGSYIEQLANKSGAKVTVSDSESREFGTVWKYVMVQGTGREVDKAKKLLYIRLDRYVSQGQSGDVNTQLTTDEGIVANDPEPANSAFIASTISNDVPSTQNLLSTSNDASFPAPVGKLVDKCDGAV